MMRMRHGAGLMCRVGFGVAGGLLMLGAAQAAAGDVERGRLLYQGRCSACHAPDYHGVGPLHRGVFGRGAGKAPGYDYSPALKAATLTWDDASLDRWLADPERLLPGQRMGVNVPDAAERADLIAYLKSLAPRQSLRKE